MRGLLLYGDTERSAALRHEIPVPIGDPFLFAEVDGQAYILTSRLETGRLARALPDAKLFDYFELGYKELVRAGSHAPRRAARSRRARYRRSGSTTRSSRQSSRSRSVTGCGPTVSRSRWTSQASTSGAAPRRPSSSKGFASRSGQPRPGWRGFRLLARSRPNVEGRLEVDGRPLLAEDVRAVLRQACAENGAPCPPDVIVASVWQGNGHEPGSGPLPAGLPIHVDVWPRHEETACWADMARTFVVGEPSPEHAERLAEMESLTQRALTEAKEAVRPGVLGRELFDATCELFESAEYPTQRTSGPDEDEGFQWSLGHGVGLEVHEAPSVGLAGREPFVVGDVIALEPGASIDGVGPLVFEDLVVVTEDGCEVLTDFPYDLAPTRA